MEDRIYNKNVTIHEHVSLIALLIQNSTWHLNVTFKGENRQKNKINENMFAYSD